MIVFSFGNRLVLSLIQTRIVTCGEHALNQPEAHKYHPSSVQIKVQKNADLHMLSWSDSEKCPFTAF